MSTIYQKNIEAETLIVAKLKKVSNLLSALRLVSIVLLLVCLYQLIVIQSADAIWQNLALVATALFVILLLIYQRNSKKLSYHKALLKLNQQEFDYLTHGKLPFENGKEFIDNSHAHSFDLDLFGEKSLFQHINRTHLSLGKKFLSRLFTETTLADEVIKRQKAVSELSEKINFRQHFAVLAALSQDKSAQTESLKQWTKSGPQNKKGLSFYLAYLLPTLFLILTVLYFIDSTLIDTKWIGYLFMINLFSVGFNYKSISKELQYSSKTGQTLASYAALVKSIKTTEFQSELLKQKQMELTSNGESAEVVIKKISRLFEQLDTVANMFIFVLFNGVFQYHNHVFFRVQKWKNAHKEDLFKWMNTVAEIEAFNSMANFAYNNKTYVFPLINTDKQFSFSELGHPLIEKDKRVCNDIDFREQRITILTGSNMSGKSTFLRTIGVNLVLAQTGAPICASSATVCPLPLWVSMRLTDSLNDGESYFYAEVKRLKQIVVEAKKQAVFVLLDEILRGTNSDDKTQGTIGVIEKLVDCGATGMIATHDLEVCSIENKHPGVLKNRSFEGLIVNDELFFDYKLRDGICQNKNATFIMKKMEII